MIGRLDGPQRITHSIFIVVTLVAIFLLASIISFSPDDPGWSQSGYLHTDFKNLMGRAGAFCSDILMFMFGYGSIMVPLAIVYVGYCLLVKPFDFFGIDFFTVGLRMAGGVFFFLSVLGIVAMNVLDSVNFQSAGVTGAIFASFFINFFGEAGATLIFLGMFALSIPLFTGISLLAVCDNVGDWIFGIVYRKSYESRARANSAILAGLGEDVAIPEEGDTVMDPETGFAILLRDDDELKFADSIYDNEEATAYDDESSYTPPVVATREHGRKPIKSVLRRFTASRGGDGPLPELSDEASALQTARRVFGGSAAKESEKVSGPGLVQPQPQPRSFVQERKETIAAAAPAVKSPTESIWSADGRDDVPLGDFSKFANPSVNQEQRAESSNVQAGVSIADEMTGSDSVLDHEEQLSSSSSIASAAPSVVMSAPLGSSAKVSESDAVSEKLDPDAARNEVVSAAESRDAPVVVDFSAAFASKKPNIDSDRAVSEVVKAEETSSLQSSGSVRGEQHDDSISEKDLLTSIFGGNSAKTAEVEEEHEGTDFDAEFARWEQERMSKMASSMSESSSVSAKNSQEQKEGHYGEEAEETDSQNATGFSSAGFDFGTDDFVSHAEITKLRGSYDPYDLPPMSLLDEVPVKPGTIPEETLQKVDRAIEQKLLEFRITAEVKNHEAGPVVTRFSLQLAPGTKSSTLRRIAGDLARELCAKSLLVIDNIPGTNYVGLEIPNDKRQILYAKEILDSSPFTSAEGKLTCALGGDILGVPKVMDLAKMPHLLVAGTTGSGKSVGVNGMIMSLLFKCTPDDLRLIMIDPKMLEFSSYAGIPHLLTEVVTDMKDAQAALRWCVGEMERRYKLMSKMGVKKIDEYNAKVMAALDEGKPLLDPLWVRTEQLSDKPAKLGKLPYIVVVIDELADMMMQVGKKVEELIARLAQKARAAGIHMIIATQSPRADVLTGLIKSNIPSRVAFTVSNGMESRIILEQQGAESLLGYGDMFYSPVGSQPVRVHAAYIKNEEIERVVDFWRSKGEPEYVDTILDDEINEENALPSEKQEIIAKNLEAMEGDELLDRAIELVRRQQRASTGLLQSQLSVGYARATKLLCQLEEAGVISAPQGASGRRKVLIGSSYEDE